MDNKGKINFMISQNIKLSKSGLFHYVTSYVIIMTLYKIIYISYIQINKKVDLKINCYQIMKNLLILFIKFLVF